MGMEGMKEGGRMDIREKALAAYIEQECERAKYLKNDRDSKKGHAVQLFHKYFGNDAVIERITTDEKGNPVLHTEPDMPPLVYVTQHCRGLFRIWGLCQQCKHGALSNPCWGLADIGKQLKPERFTADRYIHKCPKLPVRQDTDYLALAKEHFKEAAITGGECEARLAHVAILIHNAVTAE